MKFRITASEIRWAIGLGKAHAKLLVDGYPQLKGKVKIDTDGTPETTIEFNDLDELLSLVDSVGSIVIYKADCLDEKYKPIKDDKYTIEIYDDYRE